MFEGPMHKHHRTAKNKQKLRKQTTSSDFLSLRQRSISVHFFATKLKSESINQGSIMLLLLIHSNFFAEISSISFSMEILSSHKVMESAYQKGSFAHFLKLLEFISMT